MISRGGDVYTMNDSNETPADLLSSFADRARLYHAMLENNTPFANLLSLFEKCEEGNVEEVKRCLSTMSLDLNVLSKDGVHALYIAADNMRLDVVRFLLSGDGGKCNVNLPIRNGRTALHAVNLLNITFFSVFSCVPLI